MNYRNNINTGVMTPRVTVLMPVYNGERYLREAINSILAQTFTDFEFLIINDGSTDKSAEIINSYHDPRIRLVHNDKNIGLIATLNKGLDLAKGEYVARMDCDDISLPERIVKQVAFMDAHREVGVCGTWVETIGDDSGDIFNYPIDSEKIQCQLLFDSPLAHPSVMMRKSLLDKFRLRYNPQHIYAEDWGLWQRCSFCFPLRNLPEVLLQYRITRDSISRVNEERQLETLYNIDSQNLHNLGIECSPEEQQMHRNLGLWRFTSNTEFLHRTDLWLNKLQEANSQRHIYPEPAFSKVIAERRIAVYTNATNLGFETWRRFWRSPMRHKTYLSLIQKLKFGIKCITKWNGSKNN